ncbi:MAG TPA: SDR family NAD(P)-dependent oxidoreductase, partial [Bacteroidales bacterium]|nr:SDR family NAD(P)-dependent oxidoreductase [Bacteroidales bacterium]
MKIQGKIAWITGASSGIGSALATELFNRGATVVLSARNTTKLDELRIKLDKIENGRCFVIPLDVTNHDQINEAASM